MVMGKKFTFKTTSGNRKGNTQLMHIEPVLHRFTDKYHIFFKCTINLFAIN